MARSELIAALGTRHPDLKAGEIAGAVAAFFEAIEQRLSAGGRVELRGFGTFSTRLRRASAGRNPRTGERIEVIAKRAIHYQQAKAIRARLNPNSPNRKHR